MVQLSFEQVERLRPARFERAFPSLPGWRSLVWPLVNWFESAINHILFFTYPAVCCWYRLSSVVVSRFPSVAAFLISDTSGDCLISSKMLRIVFSINLDPCGKVMSADASEFTKDAVCKVVPLFAMGSLS